MKTRLARTAGFCMGVRRAMELTLAAAHTEQDKVFTFGPLIHNPQVLDLLADKGIEVLKEIPEPGSQEGGTVIIRAHGVPREKKERLKKAGFSKLIDGTCPRVTKVQAIIRGVSKKGGNVIIVGDADHPEVVGLLGHAVDNRGYVVSSPKDIPGLPNLEEVTVVAQTTQNGAAFLDVVGALKQKFPRVKVHNTICEATHNRQEEVRRLCRDVDGMVVVGGRQSGNTKRLYEIARDSGARAFLVETEEELAADELASLSDIGVTAGASTPNWMIKKVMRELSGIRSSKESRLGYILRQVFRFLVAGQVLVGVGAASMAVAASLLQNLPLNGSLIMAAAFYIFAMHILNQFLDKEAGQYNEPARAHFLNQFSWLLIGSGIFAGLCALIICATLGILPFALVTVMSGLGLLYSVPVVPKFLQKKLGIERLKDIPGSKTISASLAWATMSALIPAATLGMSDPANTALAFFFTLCLVLVRSAIFDILDVQGDLIVGSETIPIMLGEKRTKTIMWVITFGLAAVLFLAPILGQAPTLAFGLLLPVAGMAVMQLVLNRAWIMPGALSEGLVDLNFWLAGLVALIWAAF
ncbi:4-hydroxy-3-methylbut-2-enyl diphosphate reductase [Dethiosulfatarculus sandiegensis]|uniref:4-hydroxy-3-methylbut-2-enyl diphosphate reductase n=1 Tax=Dethiosulfatarculus sandiegensis TaxID=1429043 RepID=A0A0D2GE02_9BACT|nr:4-hydroxy-3-methylbut-2-enyl diphosphate reductase [Dethiosulfatarculus sandiegensis]KIX13217.1 hydroxymethylbutenyl pyrophosphate reductase [Dethiosulfatarculus sandiegensis]